MELSKYTNKEYLENKDKDRIMSPIFYNDHIHKKHSKLFLNIGSFCGT